MTDSYPTWCLIYEELPDDIEEGFVEVPRDVIPNLPKMIEGEFVYVCRRSYWAGNSENPASLPKGRVVAVKRLGDGNFEYYQIDEGAGSGEEGAA